MWIVRNGAPNNEGAVRADEAECPDPPPAPKPEAPLVVPPPSSAPPKLAVLHEVRVLLSNRVFADRAAVLLEISSRPLAVGSRELHSTQSPEGSKIWKKVRF